MTVPGLRTASRCSIRATMSPLPVLDHDRRDPLAAMAVDEAQERRQQLPLFFQFARADSCGDHLGVAARQPDGALKFLVLPFRFGLRLAADAKECAATLAANVGFLLDECRVQPGPLPRRDLNQLHRCPLSLLESMISKYNKKHCLDSRIGPRLRNGSPRSEQGCDLPPR